MTAAAEKNRPVDHVRPLPPSVIGRGTADLSAETLAALLPCEATGGAR